MNCPDCKLIISEIDEICPFCGCVIKESLNSDESDNAENISGEGGDCGADDELQNSESDAAYENQPDDFGILTMQSAGGESDASDNASDGENSDEIAAPEPDCGKNLSPDSDSNESCPDEKDGNSEEISSEPPENKFSENIPFDEKDAVTDGEIEKDKALCNNDASDECSEETDKRSETAEKTEPAETDTSADVAAQEARENSDSTEERSKDIPAKKADAATEKKRGKIDMLIDILPGTEHFGETLDPKEKRAVIAASFPFMFWLTYISDRHKKSMIFFANQSLSLTFIFIFNCLIWLIFNIVPFSKTVSFENAGVTFFKSVGYLPWYAAALIIFLFVLWAVLSALNVCCAAKNRKKEIFPCNLLRIIR
ncbi:MAG: hypothetical protein ACI4QV_02720 [Acutalibacteraceae bacterium]